MLSPPLLKDTQSNISKLDVITLKENFISLQGNCATRSSEAKLSLLHRLKKF